MDKSVGSVMSTFETLNLKLLFFLYKNNHVTLADGDGSSPETHMFAKYPRTPSDSVSNTPGGPRRRIRCKMCRYVRIFGAFFTSLIGRQDKN